MAVVEESEPLLKNSKKYYESCSGCRVERRKESETSVPYKKLFSIWLIALGSALPSSSIFPFLYFMIRDFHVAEREEDTSYYAGYVGSALMLGRGLTSIFWGVVADRYGRKPVIIIGTISVVVFNTLFGLSVNFWMAITLRFLLGSANGLFGPIKAYATELCREEHQALALSTISTAWSIGLIVGPSVGGFLAQPAEKYPNIFSKESLFGRFPYFLPCLCISLFAAGVSVFTFSLEETLHKHPETPSEDKSYKALESATCGSCPKETSRRSILKNWQLMSTFPVYCITSFHDMAYSEIFSLWSVSPRSFGGLGFSTKDVGEILSVTDEEIYVGNEWWSGYGVPNASYGGSVGSDFFNIDGASSSTYNLPTPTLSDLQRHQQHMFWDATVTGGTTPQEEPEQADEDVRAPRRRRNTESEVVRNIRSRVGEDRNLGDRRITASERRGG